MSVKYFKKSLGLLMNKWTKIFDKNSSYIKESPYNLMSYSLFSKVYSDALNYSDFLKIMEFISNALRLKKNSSILDYGSGNGAILLYFLKNYFLKKNISIEINKSFINFQKKFINHTKLLKGNFNNPQNFLSKIKSNSVDNIMCNSVFQYFVSEKKAMLVLMEFIRIAKKRIFIYDIKNKESEKEYRETVRKRQGFSKIKFKEKYRETPIRSYNKSFFLKNNKLNNIVKSVKIYPIPKCALDGKFAFCLMIEKK
jgi:phospholipid N-methyltransferase|tara:strand:+ start:190 stop:951 length:762 start_codon:yes stop_codon:yes gene_type:complete